ncbi:hypothetical protein HER10_EVM0011151 [Colletotrichum scovillei]|uniref:uncharacterized protein n=1 Tax=Colletotrichum scovillei TaxID=1209932 RepID=UPI0015C38C53|nr:uncharacterized protein HER10_EVM0011151 [Colletotrichum scovillei]KAF4785891.1 hypothetical protein HER10_EVM0011151 [Colletotrichum scovillei]
MESIGSGKMWPLFASRRKATLDSFFHSQWQFLAPVFTTNSFRHKLHPSCPLPFIVKINHQKAGFFSSVFEVVIHDAHQKIKGKKIRVASKEMRIGMDSYYEKEADILETIRNVDNPHLIKPLAAYRRGDLRGFLFPWGEGGNLKEFWSSQEKLRPVPVRDPHLVLWVLRQLQGICGSISALHERNCRHGDLKPENILHFLETGGKGVLRVADVGLARFHLEATRDRNQPTNTMTGTVRYEPPEFGLTEQISRLYDVGFPTLPETGSPEQYVLLNEWLRVCDEQHSHGVDDRTELPTRVLDVGTDPNSTIHLCEGKLLPLERYTALSHCWGVNSQAQVRTLKENIDVFRKRIDFGILPKSFQDAVKITRALGLRYLWIDSLCIIQNDKQDWAFEATRMEHVFSSAYVTIAATAASSSAEGFLRQKAKHPFVTLEGPNGRTTFVRKSIDDFHQDVEQAVLNQRGWVLQERALSRRILHFTASQVYWECGNGVHCETLMKLSNRQAALLGDSDFPKSALEYFKGGRIVTFQTLYQMYSRLAFTVPSDRSIGIKGLEERLVKDFATKGGFGIFDEYLQRSLLWQKAPDASLDRISYPPDRRVPSWSWMAYQGQIAYLEAPFEHINWTKDIITPFNTDSGKKTHWEVSEGSEIPLLRGVASRISLDDIELLKRVRFDESRPHTIDHLRCIVVGREKTEGLTREPEHYVLVIARLSKEQGGRYERVGVGRLLAEHILLREPQLDVEVQ